LPFLLFFVNSCVFWVSMLRTPAPDNATLNRFYGLHYLLPLLCRVLRGRGSQSGCHERTSQLTKLASKASVQCRLYDTCICTPSKQGPHSALCGFAKPSAQKGSQDSHLSSHPARIYMCTWAKKHSHLPNHPARIYKCTWAENLRHTGQNRVHKARLL
jgi:hypothetical protein